MKQFIYIITISLGLFILNGCQSYYNLFYTDPAKCFKIAEQRKPYDVIIVPGFPHDSGNVNMVVSQRVKWAYYLYKNGYTKNIIFSGAAVHSPYIEANMMRLFALQLGVKNENIFTETKAEHTTENLYYSCVLASQLGFKTIGFATEPAQASFMKPFKRKFNLQVDFIPVVADSLWKLPLQLKPINPIAEQAEFIPNFIPLEKRESIFENLRGSRGHRVKKDIRRARKLKRQHS
ncbi:MAG: YdcF family protein [Bacteroidetes bacterium]|nr:YdcF family protein [Bacteroidota bacterium]